MKILFYVLIFLIIQNISHAGVKKEIINKFQSINNLTFKFKQNTNEKKKRVPVLLNIQKKYTVHINQNLIKSLYQMENL